MSVELTPIHLGKIYKLHNPYNPSITDCYVGSTKRKLNHRLNEHKSNIRTKNLKSCFLEDIDNLQIELLEEFEFINKKDLLYRERYWYEKLKPSLNKCFPIRNKKEYLNIYYQMNKHIISKKRSEVMKCVFCDRNYTKRHKARHQKSLYCLEKQKELKNNNVE